MIDTKEIITNIVVLAVAIVTVVIAILTYLRRGKIKFGQLQVDFGKVIEADVEHVRKIISETAPGASSADKQYLLLREYHAQGLAQSKISFWFSLIFASLGFAVIVIAILTMERGVQLTEQGRSFITLIAGTIIDAVAALFFVQSNKARQLMTEFFDKLRADRKLEESLNLASQVPDQILQSRLKIIIAMNLADVKSSEAILPLIIGTQSEIKKINE